MEFDEKQIKICVNVDGRPFTFQGKCTHEDENTITIFDKKDGKMKFLKANLLYINEVSQ